MAGGGQKSGFRLTEYVGGHISQDPKYRVFLRGHPRQKRSILENPGDPPSGGDAGAQESPPFCTRLSDLFMRKPTKNEQMYSVYTR